MKIFARLQQKRFVISAREGSLKCAFWVCFDGHVLGLGFTLLTIYPPPVSLDFALTRDCLLLTRFWSSILLAL